MGDAMWAWFLYGAASAVILYAGYQVCRETDALAVRRRWTRGWAGLLVLATVTSLPELFTGLSAVRLADAPRIAVADVAGSLAFNLLILGLLAIAARRRLFQVSSPSHRVAAADAAAVAVLAAGAVVGWPYLPGPAAPWLLMGFLPLYLAIMWDLHRRGVAPEATDEAPSGGALRLVMHGIVLVAASAALPYAGAAIADSTGLGRTFVGGLLVAASTSLPEVAVTFAAWRIGAPDLAVGNLVGSNLFDVAILSLDEAAYPGALLKTTEAGHAVLFAAAAAMAGLAWIGFRWPMQASGRWLGGGMLAIYLVAQAFVYQG
jgi:cation:H+ antiporter